MKLNPYLNQEDFRLATFLDPRFKTDWLQTDKERALLKKASIQSTKELLKRKAVVEVDSCERPSSSDHNERTAARPTPKKKTWLTQACSFSCRQLHQENRGRMLQV